MFGGHPHRYRTATPEAGEPQSHEMVGVRISAAASPPTSPTSSAEGAADASAAPVAQPASAASAASNPFV